MTMQTPEEFIITHCRRCAAGWTRTTGEGKIFTVCLLDRNPVMPTMTACDRFAPMTKPTAES